MLSADTYRQALLLTPMANALMHWDIDTSGELLFLKAFSDTHWPN